MFSPSHFFLKTLLIDRLIKRSMRNQKIQDWASIPIPVSSNNDQGESPEPPLLAYSCMDVDEGPDQHVYL